MAFDLGFMDCRVFDCLSIFEIHTFCRSPVKPCGGMFPNAMEAKWITMKQVTLDMRSTEAKNTTL